MKIKKQMRFIALMSWLGVSTQAQVLLYNMNDLADGATSASASLLSSIPSLTLAGADLVAAGQAGVSFTDASGTVHPAGLAAAWGSGLDAPGGNSFQLCLDTTGFESFAMRYDYRSTSSGSPSAQLSYRLGGSGAFTPYDSQSFTQDGAYHSASIDLSPISSINNASDVYLRWELAPGSGSGTFRMDNVELTGAAAVPEPRSYMLVAGAFLAVVAARRRAGGCVPACGAC